MSMVGLALLLVPALAAALVGRVSSFTATLAGAFAIGIAESELTRYVTFPGASKALPLLLLLAMLALSGHAFPARGDAAGRPNKPGSGRVGPIGGIATAVPALPGRALPAGLGHGERACVGKE